MVDEINMLKAVPVKLKNSGKEGLDNQGDLKTEVLQFETAFDLDQAADTNSTDNVMFPGTPSDVYVIEGFRAKVSEAFAFTTLVPHIGLVAAGGAASTAAIAVHEFATTQAVGDIVQGTYDSAATVANPKLKVRGGTLYEVSILTRPTGGIVTGQIKQLFIDYRRARSNDAD